MADINTKYTYVLEALRADGKRVMRFTNKPDNRAQVLINNGYKPVDETSKVEFIKLEISEGEVVFNQNSLTQE